MIFYPKMYLILDFTTFIEENIKQMINSRLIDTNRGNGGNIHLAKGDTSDMYYACAVKT